MLDKQTFAVGIGTIVTLIGEKANHMKSGTAYDLLFSQLNDLDQRYFIPGISKLIQSEDIKFFPSVYQIRKYVLELSNFGYSNEELIDMAEVRKLTKKPYSNPNFDYLISSIDIEKSKNQPKLTFIKDNINAITN